MTQHVFSVIAFNQRTGMVTLRNPWNAPGNWGAQFDLVLVDFIAVMSAVAAIPMPS